MKLETIYNELLDIMKNDMDFMKAMKLKNELEDAIRKETCYKTTSKTRVNAIKRIASKDESRPVLTGYGIMDDYKCVTDSYHAIMIHEDNMPLKLVTSDDKLAEKVGKENCIFGTYPNFKNIFPTDEDLKNNFITTELDFDDIAQFYKLHKKNPLDDPYKIKQLSVSIILLKNAIDVLGTDITVYIDSTSDCKPIIMKNKDNEMAIVLPIRTY